MKRCRVWLSVVGLLWAAMAAAAEPTAPVAPVKDPPAAAPKAPPTPPVVDRLDLDATEVTGNRELPKVMVIVPWKHTEAGDVAGRPTRSVMDEVLQPVDREVMRREMDYFGKLGTASPPSHSQPEN
jgi:hypothetical protein